MNSTKQLAAALIYARQVIDQLSEKAHGRADREYCMRILKPGNSIDQALADHQRELIAAETALDIDRLSVREALIALMDSPREGQCGAGTRLWCGEGKLDYARMALTLPIDELTWHKPANALPAQEANDLPDYETMSKQVLIKMKGGLYYTATYRVEVDTAEGHQDRWVQSGRDGYSCETDDIERWAYID